MSGNLLNEPRSFMDNGIAYIVGSLEHLFFFFAFQPWQDIVGAYQNFRAPRIIEVRKNNPQDIHILSHFDLTCQPE